MKATVKFEYTSNYWLSHLVNREETEILMAFHGYGQLAEFFLKKLAPIFKEERLVVVPEANNHAYLEGFSGRVGANWMTRHERETAIRNNQNYFDELLRLLLLKYPKPPKLKILGFSQGAATASRWVSNLDYEVDTLVLWGGGFAHDLILDEKKTKFHKTKTYIALGTRDEFITEESLQKQEKILKSMKLNIEKRYYDGGHDLNLPLLKELLEG
ncbi:alpha/beta hydrolase [Arthrospiribacter ruber]|uniref:Alpha/beta hydrolase n=1 Tax=Arthrospiribacter ruber TaxID=2487934 RepID=A0A951IYL2_9BACT|nr:dienelactone hydrolase family protein [Arthrospiribacter ruber]MBW3468787.1 alpha/beta hydrolase [Arthrospiribacter ruber]